MLSGSLLRMKVPAEGRLKGEPGSAAAGCCPTRCYWPQAVVALTWKRRRKSRVADVGTEMADRIASWMVMRTVECG